MEPIGRMHRRRLARAIVQAVDLPPQANRYARLAYHACGLLLVGVALAIVVLA